MVKYQNVVHFQQGADDIANLGRRQSPHMMNFGGGKW
jgi:hypothetical protein